MMHPGLVLVFHYRNKLSIFYSVKSGKVCEDAPAIVTLENNIKLIILFLAPNTRIGLI